MLETLSDNRIFVSVTAALKRDAILRNSFIAGLWCPYIPLNIWRSSYSRPDGIGYKDVVRNIARRPCISVRSSPQLCAAILKKKVPCLNLILCKVSVYLAVISNIIGSNILLEICNSSAGITDITPVLVHLKGKGERSFNWYIWLPNRPPSGDFGTRVQESSNTIYIVELELVCFVYLYHQPLY